MNTHLSYFEKDVKYDKRFYTSDWKDVLWIIGALIAFYTLFSLVFWGMVAFCTTNTEQAMWTNVGLFIATFVWILSQAGAGYYTNQKLARYHFYMEKIGEKEQELKDVAAREEQMRIQEEKLAQQKNLVAGHSSQHF